MFRSLLVSSVMHVSLGLGLVFGMPAIPFDFSVPSEIDIEMQIVDVEDDAALFDLAALGEPEPEPELDPIAEGLAQIAQAAANPEPEAQTPQTQEREPEPEVETPSDLDLADALRELQMEETQVDIPTLDATQATQEDAELDVAQQDTLEIEVDNARMQDLEAEASLGNGGEQEPEPTAAEEEPTEAAVPAEVMSQADLDAQTVDGGDVDALMELMNALQNSDDQFPPADADTAEAVQDEFNPEVAAEEPEPEDQAQEELEAAPVDPNTPTDEESLFEIANLPLPKVRPTRRAADYVDPDSPDDQAKIVSAARQIFEEPETDVDEDAVTAQADDILDALAGGATNNVNAVAGSGTGTQGEGAGSDPAGEAEAKARQAARNAANNQAMATINQRIQPDWPAFARGQFGWVVEVRVALRDAEGYFVQLETKVTKAPAQATGLQIQTMEQAVKSAVAASQPWPIPMDYAEDWINTIVFPLCPPKGALSSSSGCS